VGRILRTLVPSPADEDCRDSQSTVRAQSNVDFVIAMFMMLIFFSVILFAPGSPLLEASQSTADERIDAQRVAAELTSQLGDANGQLDVATMEAIVDDNNDDETLEDYTTTDDDIGVAIGLLPTLATEADAPFFDDGNYQEAGDLPESAAGTSFARKTVRIDNRPVILEVFVWREA